MNRKLLYALLFISLAFNIAVLGSFIYHLTLHKRFAPNENMQEMKDNFDGLKNHRPDIHLKYRRKIKPLNDKNHDLRLSFMEELIKAEPDYKILAQLNEKIQKTIQEISMNFYNEMIEMRKTLTPEEAKSFYGHQRRMMKKRFDHQKELGEMGPPNGEREMGLPNGERGMEPSEWNRREPRRNRRPK